MVEEKNRLGWCKGKDVYKFGAPNLNLGHAYIEEALATVESASVTEGKWKVIMAYYACYSAFYALVIKEGIKCENHDCTLALLEILLEFSKKEIDFLHNLKEYRIQNQYYMKNKQLADFAEVKNFVAKCRILLSKDLNLLQKVKNGKK